MKPRRTILRLLLLFSAMILLVCIRLNQPDIRLALPAPMPHQQNIALPGAGSEAEYGTESGINDNNTAVLLNRPGLSAPALQPPGTALPQIMLFAPEIQSPHTESADAVTAHKSRHPKSAPKLPVTPNRNDNLSEQIMIKTLPSLFQGEEGSYSDAVELFGGNSPRSTNLRSDWMTKHLLPGRNIPLLRMRILQDPFTGEYRISGGAVALPGTGLEAGYETEPGTDDYKTILQWKKSF